MSLFEFEDIKFDEEFYDIYYKEGDEDERFKKFVNNVIEYLKTTEEEIYFDTLYQYELI